MAKQWVYTTLDSCVFFRTKEEFGALSNMSGGHPIKVGDYTFSTSETLYQCLRFNDVVTQKEVASQKTAYAAKEVAHLYADHTRPDWDTVRVTAMDWALRAKAMSSPAFVEVLQSTGEKYIVEKSFKDTFWGACPSTNEVLVGSNVLGRLLMRIRHEISTGIFILTQDLLAPSIQPSFQLFGEPNFCVRYQPPEKVPNILSLLEES